MSLHKYAIFATVVESGSLTRASEQLGLTQSAVSHALSSLEQEFGFSILMRSRSGVASPATESECSPTCARCCACRSRCSRM